MTEEALISQTEEIVARDTDGKVLLRRPQTAAELAQDVHGPLQPVREWQVHPACHNPPHRFGACTMRFPDGRYWCFGCEAAWLPGQESERLTAAFSIAVPETPPLCPEHGRHLIPLSRGWWCVGGGHEVHT